MDEWNDMVASYRAKNERYEVVERNPERIPRIISKLHQVWSSNPGVSLCGLVHTILVASPGDLLRLAAVSDDRLETLLDAALKRVVARSSSPVDRVPMPGLAGMRGSPIAGDAEDVATASDTGEQQPPG